MEHDSEKGYKMGVYLCLGQPIYHLKHNDSMHIKEFMTFKAIQEYIGIHGKIFLFLGEGQHKIKRKAEQIACNEAITILNLNNTVLIEEILPE